MRVVRSVYARREMAITVSFLRGLIDRLLQSAVPRWRVGIVAPISSFKNIFAKTQQLILTGIIRYEYLSLYQGFTTPYMAKHLKQGKCVWVRETIRPKVYGTALAESDFHKVYLCDFIFWFLNAVNLEFWPYRNNTANLLTFSLHFSLLRQTLFLYASQQDRFSRHKG